ncbi:MAG TPA: hypothetical protein VGE41_02425 [Verrucomicrobiae bacterium]|jgi:cytochrome c556
MKANKFFALSMAALLGCGLAVYAQDKGRSRKEQATKEFMREKLELAQKVLEALALEDFSTIEAKAQKLSAMSQASSWQIFDNPDYVQYSAEFRKNVDALKRAAERKNIDSATLAYVRVTMSCVDCHKFVRGKLVAQAAGPALASAHSIY